MTRDQEIKKPFRKILEIKGSRDQEIKRSREGGKTGLGWDQQLSLEV